MNISAHVIPQHTIDTLAKGLYREAVQYGFEQKDILRFVNSLLLLSMKSPKAPIERENQPIEVVREMPQCEKV